MKIELSQYEVELIEAALEFESLSYLLIFKSEMISY